MTSYGKVKCGVASAEHDSERYPQPGTCVDGTMYPLGVKAGVSGVSRIYSIRKGDSRGGAGLSGTRRSC